MLLFLVLSLLDQLVELPLRVLGTEPIDQIADLLVQPAIVHVGGNTGRELVDDFVQVFRFQAGGVGLCPPAVPLPARSAVDRLQAEAPCRSRISRRPARRVRPASRS